MNDEPPKPGMETMVKQLARFNRSDADPDRPDQTAIGRVRPSRRVTAIATCKRAVRWADGRVDALAQRKGVNEVASGVTVAGLVASGALVWLMVSGPDQPEPRADRKAEPTPTETVTRSVRPVAPVGGPAVPRAVEPDGPPAERKPSGPAPTGDPEPTPTTGSTSRAPDPAPPTGSSPTTPDPVSPPADPEPEPDPPADPEPPPGGGQQPTDPEPENPGGGSPTEPETSTEQD